MVIRDTLGNQFILKDCWLHIGWLTDIDIHQLLQDSRRDQQEPDMRTQAIFGSRDLYEIFSKCQGTFPADAKWDQEKNLPGIPICHKYEFVKCDTWDGGGHEDTTDYLLQTESVSLGSYEPRQHIWVSFLTCAIPITWFSCIREFFNATMGILAGKKILLKSDSIDSGYNQVTTMPGRGDRFSTPI